MAAVTMLVAGGAMACGVAYGNPTAPQVVNGQATFATQGNTLTVTNTPGTIINWQSFSNAADEVTRFVQQSSTSSVLNRVVGVDPSTILGALQSNGRVFLINPNGILFGAGARIDVNGLIASTLPLSNADFLAGKFSGTAGPVAGAIRNQGAITTPAGGKVWLIAPEVENSGIITAPEGEILLAAGRSVHLVDSTTPDIAVVVSAPEDKAINLGRIISESGKVGIYGGLLAQKGIVSADSAVVGKDGKIFFKSTHGTTLDTGSVTTASGARGGEITVSSTEGTTTVAGTVAATGSESNGGSVKILGDGVSLLDQAHLDTSGASGGGILLVGGDYQGKNPAVQNAQTAYVAKNALLLADALSTGDGGKIVVWSDGSTRAYGTLSARGGSLGGNGGLIETSGHFLDVAGSMVDAAAPRGKAGTWLLDPLDIIISGTSLFVDFLTDTPAAGTDTISPNNTGSEVFAADIISRLDAGTNVKITTSVAGAEAGNITVNALITKSGASPASSLLLDAAGDIILNQSITNTSSTPLDVTLTAGGGISSSGGTVDLAYGVLTASAGTGISLSGNVPTFNATNGTSGGITFSNSGMLTVGNITQNSSFPVLITSNGDMKLGSINAVGGGVVTLRAHNGSITDFNSIAPNISGAYRVDFNDGSTTTPGSVGTNLDAIEVQNLGLGGITAQAGSGGIYLANTAGSLKLGGIVYTGTSGDVLITSSTDTAITGALLSLSGHTGNMTVDVSNASLILDAAVNKGGSGNLLLRASGSSSDININSNILGNGNGVTIQAGRDILFNGRDTGAGIVDNLVNGTGISLLLDGNIAQTLANLSGTNFISIRSISDDRPITIGSACTTGGCLLLSNLSATIYNTPNLRIGNDVTADPNTAGNIDIASAFSRSAGLSLLSGGSITQSADATIGVLSLALSGSSVDLREANPVGVVAGRSTSGDFLYRSSNLLTLSNVDGFSGITAAGSAWLESDSTLGINQIGGSTISAPGTLVLSTVGQVNLMDGGNNVGTIAADLFQSGTGGGGLQFSNGPRPLIINSGLGIAGIRTNNQPIMVMAGGTPANGLVVRNAVNGGNSFVNLIGSSISLDSGSSVSGASVRLSAIEPTGLGTISTAGPVAPVVQAQKSIELEADNLSFSANPSFTVSATDIMNEIDIMPHTGGRPITVGAACAAGGPCLLLKDVSTAIFNAPTLVIGSENMLPTTSSKAPVPAGDISIASAITRPGRLALLTGGAVSQTAPISVDALAVVAPGAVNLTASNSVGKLAALTDDAFAFTTTGALEVLTVTGGIDDPATIEGVDSLGSITLTSGGNLTLSAPIDAGNQTVTLNAGGAIIDGADRSLYPASIYAGNLIGNAIAGIGSAAAPLMTSVASFSGKSDSGDIILRNEGGLNVGAVSNLTGGIDLAAKKGDLSLAGLLSAGTGVTLGATNGAILHANGTLASVKAPSFTATAATGIGTTAAPLITVVSNLSATSGIGNIVIGNTGAMTIGALSTGGTGSITFDNTGAVTSGASTIQAPGAVTLVAHSPLTIGTGGVSAGGNVLLEAAASGGSDNMVVAGNVVSNSGSIDLRAGDTVSITGTVSAPAGTATKTEKLNTSTPLTTDLKAKPLTSSPTVQTAVDQLVTETTQITPTTTVAPTTQPTTVTGGTATDSASSTSSTTTSSDTTSGATSTDSAAGTSDSTATSSDATALASSDSSDDGATASTGGATSEETAADSSDKKEEEKKDADKKQEKGKNDGEKKTDAPKKKQYCN